MRHRCYYHSLLVSIRFVPFLYTQKKSYGCFDYDTTIAKKLLKNLICDGGDALENNHVWIGPITNPVNREILEYEIKIQENVSTHIRYIKNDKFIPLVRHNSETYFSFAVHKQMDSSNIHLEYRNLMNELQCNIDNYICDNIDDINKLNFIVNELGIINDSTIVNYVRNYSDVNNFICSFISDGHVVINTIMSIFYLHF